MIHERAICLSDAWGGLEQVVLQDAIAHADRGARVSVNCLAGSPLHERLRQAGRELAAPLAFRPRNLLDLRLRSELRRALDAGVNIVHVHQPSLLGSVLPWLPAGPRAPVGVFASRHIRSNHQKRSAYHRWLYRRLRALIVMSEGLRANVIETHAIDPARVVKIALGLDLTRFDPVRVSRELFRSTWNVRADETLFGIVGRLDPEKGQTIFLHAAARLVGEQPEARVKFVLVGEETRHTGRAYRAELEALVQSLGLAKRVIFAGHQSDVPAVMRALDGLVMPSRAEAFGLVAIEAMAMECPVIMTSGGSADEIVGADQSRGRRVEMDRPDVIAGLLNEWICDPAQRQSLGKAARSHVLAHYDERLRTDRTLELYRKAIG